MKRLQKLLLTMALMPFGCVFGMVERKEAFDAANKHLKSMVENKSCGGEVIHESIQKLKGFYTPNVDLIKSPASVDPRNILIQATFDQKGNPTGELAHLHKLAQAARTLSSMSRAHIALIPGLSGQVYLEVRADGYKQLKKETSLIANSKNDKKIKRSNSFSGTDSDIRAYEASAEKEKMAQQISELSKKLADFEHSGKNGHANGNANGNGKQDLNACLDLREKIAKLQKEIESKQNENAELKIYNEKLTEQARAAEEEKKTLENEVEEWYMSQKNKKRERKIENSRLSTLLVIKARKIDELENNISARDASSWRKYFIGGAVTLASYTGLKAAYNWYTNKA